MSKYKNFVTLFFIGSCATFTDLHMDSPKVGVATLGFYVQIANVTNASAQIKITSGGCCFVGVCWCLLLFVVCCCCLLLLFVVVGVACCCCYYGGQIFQNNICIKEIQVV